MSQDSGFTYFPPDPNSLGDNNNSLNTTSSLNHSNNSFNRNNNFSYTNIVVIINNTSNEVDERSAVEITRRIPETLPPP